MAILSSIIETYVDQFDPTASFGSATLIDAQLSAGADREAYTDFEVRDNILAGSTVDTATFRFKVVVAATSGSIRIAPIIGGGVWSEASTWNSIVADQPTLGVGTVDKAVSSKGIYTVDVKAIVQELVDAEASEQGFKIVQTGTFLTHIGVPITDPLELDVTWTPPAGGLVKRGSWRGTNRGAWRGAG